MCVYSNLVASSAHAVQNHNDKGRKGTLCSKLGLLDNSHDPLLPLCRTLFCTSSAD